MTANSIERESMKMEFLDLPDDALIHVFSYLDHRSQMEAMLVCRRFELLLRENAQFYSNYKLAWNGNDYRFKSPNYIGRYSGEVSVYNCRLFSPANKFFQSLMKTFEIIGPRINKLELKHSSGCKMLYFDVLRHGNNVRELRIELKLLTTTAKFKNVDLQQFTFPNLKSLELNLDTNSEIFVELFHSVNSLHHLKLSEAMPRDWAMYQHILNRQNDLRSLELQRVFIDSIEWKSWKIEKLKMREVEFLNKEVFEKFAAFVKTLHNVSEVNLDIEDDESRNNNNYSEILFHLLNLPSLRTVQLTCRNELNFRVQNPKVMTYYIDSRSMELSVAARIFPNIQKVELRTANARTGDLMALNSLKSLVELKISSVAVGQWSLMKCSQLRKFSTYQPDFQDSSFLEAFGEKNPNIEFLELRKTSFLHSKFDPQYVLNLLKYLLNLKTLKLLGIWFTGSTMNKKVVRLIGRKLIRGNLEHFEISLPWDPASVVAFYKSNFPQLRCVFRKMTDPRKLTKDHWLLIIRKY